ncbi:hypothetical protein [Sedimentitalea todarodis]|uniref:Uncharacterized protein n=1 Tax=Sedimentitalea todarodis TaxID=1631240 RepID=A0ABU3V893_9RHOB|nr:hypothetical protein [Sedimentitalea todarodis]MDU9002387.1 hypothetical protein [Sedimentitalea todarodis]
MPALLKPHLGVFLRPQMRALCDSAQVWSVSRSAADKARLRHEAATLAKGWNQSDARPVVLATKDLVGRMP